MRQNSFMRLVSAFFLSAASSIAWALNPPEFQWHHNHGGTEFEVCYTVQQTTDGGYILGGRSASGAHAYRDARLVKTDASGNHVWTGIYHRYSYDDRFLCVLQTSDGGYLCAGDTEPIGASIGQLWLYKVNSTGGFQWQQLFGGNGDERCNDMIPTQDGGHLIFGYSSSFGAGDRDGYAVKVGADGSLQWQRTYGGTAHDYITNAVQLADGSYRLTGQTNSFGAGSADAWFIRTDAFGNMLGHTTYGGGSNEYMGNMVLAPDGGFYISGTTESYGAGGRDIWILHTNANGDTLWTRTWGTGNWEEGLALTADNTGGCVVTGYQSTTARDGVIIKYDLTGNLIWAVSAGGAGDDIGRAIKQTSDLGYIIAGSTTSFGDPDGDYWLCKFGPETYCNPDQSPVIFDGEDNPDPVFISDCIHFCHDVPMEVWVPVCPGHVEHPFLYWYPGCQASQYGCHFCNEDCDPVSNLILGEMRYEMQPYRHWVQPVSLDPASLEGCACFVMFAPSNWYWTGDCWLPVELASFEAVQESDHVLIRFATASESETDYFEIMRGRSPEEEFVKISEVPSQGNSTSEQRYAFRDLDVRLGNTYYYYLCDVTLEGSRTEHRDLMSSVTIVPPALPLEFALMQNYPNPFNASTTILYTLPEAAYVTLTIYNVEGQQVATLVEATQNAGEHSIVFEADELASGLYLCAMKTATYSTTMKMILIR